MAVASQERLRGKGLGQTAGSRDVGGRDFDGPANAFHRQSTTGTEAGATRRRAKIACRDARTLAKDTNRQEPQPQAPEDQAPERVYESRPVFDWQAYEAVQLTHLNKSTQMSCITP